MRHDEIHHLRTLSAYLGEDTQKAKEYLHSLSSELENIPTVRFSANKLVNSIFSAVSYNAKEQAINLTVQANVETTLDIQDKDLSTILMNLCDNALRAAKDSQAKQVNVLLSQDNGILYITISNSASKNFDKKGFYETLNKKKSNNNSVHGHGILSVRNILARYGGELHYEIEEGCVLLRTAMQFKK